MNNKKMSPREAREKAIEAIREGRVEFAHPMAEECFPILDESSAEATASRGFHYLKVEPLPARKWQGERERYSHDGGMYFQWGIKGFGFGEASVIMRNGEWTADLEGLGKGFLADMLKAWAEQIK